MVADLRARFAEAPGWNGGHHYGNAEMLGFMTELRVATLKRYGIEAELAREVSRSGEARGGDPSARGTVGEGLRSQFDDCAGAGALALQCREGLR